MGTSVPREVSLDTLLNIIKGWYSANAHEETCPNGDVADRVGISKRYISLQNDFLIELGILSDEGNGKMLTDAGREYAEALRYDRDDAWQYLIPLLYEYEPTDSIVDFVGIRNPDKDTALEQLYKITGYDLEEDDVALEALLDLYIEAGVLHEIEDGILDSFTEEEFNFSEFDQEETHHEDTNGNKDEEGEEQISSSEEFEPSATSRTRGIQVAEMKKSTGSALFQVNIEMELEGNENPEQVRQIVLGIREALEVELGEIGDINGDDDNSEQTGLNSF